MQTRTMFKANLNSLSFVLVASYVMSISTGLVLPLLLPHPSYIAFALMLGVLVFFEYSGRRVHYGNSRMVLSLGVLFILFAAFGILGKTGDDSIAVRLQPPLLIFLLIAVFLSARAGDLRRLLKFYIVFSVIMALCGAIAWVLINTEMVDLTKTMWSLNDATSGRAPRDADYDLYSFPYGLGLVLTGSYQYDFFSVIFYRASGWAHEPTTATVFIAPAMILLVREPLFTPVVRLLFLAILLLFWGMCASVASGVAYAGLAVFYLLFSGGVIRKLGALGLLSLVYLVYQGAQSLFESTSENVSLVGSKLESDGGARLQDLVSPANLQEAVILGLLIVMAIVILYFAIRALRSRRREAVSFALILVYFLLHSLKGDWGHIFSSFFVVGFFIFLLRAELSNWKITEMPRRRTLAGQ